MWELWEFNCLFESWHLYLDHVTFLSLSFSCVMWMFWELACLGTFGFNWHWLSYNSCVFFFNGGSDSSISSQRVRAGVLILNRWSRGSAKTWGPRIGLRSYDTQHVRDVVTCGWGIGVWELSGVVMYLWGSMLGINLRFFFFYSHLKYYAVHKQPRSKYVFISRFDSADCSPDP